MKPVDNGDKERIMNVPAITLEDIVIFPFALTPLMLVDVPSTRTAEAALNEERFLSIFYIVPNQEQLTQANGQPVIPPESIHPVKMNDKDVSPIGVLVRIVKMVKFPDGTIRLLVRGLSRVRYLSPQGRFPYLTVKVERLEPKRETSVETLGFVRSANRMFHDIFNLTPNFPEEMKVTADNLTDHTRIIDLMADALPLSYAEKFALFTTESLHDRAKIANELVMRELEFAKISMDVQQKVRSTMNRQQHEYFLREQLRQVKEELGEGQTSDAAKFLKKLEGINMPDEIREIVKKEINRLETTPPSVAEYNIAYTYVDWLLSIPWNNFTPDRLDVKEAARILDEDHFGLEDVKERILEFLAVLQLKKDRKSPIICFVGPPGVGKTSLGKSIATAMGRKFVRISLGGIKDEAEVRGHRRTYVGALPGRIIQGMKRAGTSNPVFMLDELDKLGHDYRGDPASALLEVLDPQQNNTFNDHYLEVDYDLSPVMFIATANVEETIPKPLLDRMEIVRLPGYTATEKHQIAKRYLIPRQMKENGLHSDDIRFTRNAVDKVISNYTMEAGVRTLERTFGSICRKVARKIVEGELTPGSGYLVTPEIVRELLGGEKFLPDKTDFTPKIGVATGMAWTSVGGTTLPVEALKMPGKGELKLTGSLGDVMKESAAAAFSYIRSHAEKLGIDDDVFTKNDFHIHVPDGATPKDGPSAGVTLTTALVSLLTNKPVQPRLAMTGEITLRGSVTAIGGVKEKVIGALRAGITDIILPEENRKDMEDIPEDVQAALSFHFVETIDDVLKLAVPSRIKTAKAKKKNQTAENEDEIYTFSIEEENISAETPADGTDNTSV